MTGEKILDSFKDKLKKLRAGHEAPAEARVSNFEEKVKEFKAMVVPMLEAIEDEYKTPLDRRYPSTWGTQETAKDFGIYLDQVFCLRFSIERSSGGGYVEIWKQIVEPREGKPVGGLVKSAPLVPSKEEIEPIFLEFLEDFYRARRR